MLSHENQICFFYDNKTFFELTTIFLSHQNIYIDICLIKYRKKISFLEFQQNFGLLVNFIDARKIWFD